MSAYALPGLFFLSSCSQSAEVKSEKKAMEKLSSLSLQTDTADSATIASSVSSNSVWSNDGLKDHTPPSNLPSWYRRQKYNLFVTIKSASIDPARLIHTLTHRRGSITKPNSMRSSFGSSSIHESPVKNRDNFLKLFSPRRIISNSHRGSIDSTCTMDSHFYGAECDLDDVEFPSPPSSPTRHDTRRISIDHITIEGEESTPTRASFYGVSPSLPVCNGLQSSVTNDDAVQFVLSVDFDGRKYTAMRTLPSFIKLREDIIRELSATICNANTSTTNRRVANHSMSDEESLSSDDQDMDDVHPFSIPELPVGQGNLLDDMESGAFTNVGFAGRGFSRLQAMMTSYCPVMEEWLHSVTLLVPDSPSLHDFLWEPVSADTQVASILFEPSNSSDSDNSDTSFHRRSLKNSVRSSVSTLCSIDESFGDDDEHYGEKRDV